MKIFLGIHLKLKMKEQELVELMNDHNIGVSVVRSVEMKKIDSDYFEEPV